MENKDCKRSITLAALSEAEGRLNNRHKLLSGTQIKTSLKQHSSLYPINKTQTTHFQALLCLMTL